MTSCHPSVSVTCRSLANVEPSTIGGSGVIMTVVWQIPSNLPLQSPHRHPDLDIGSVVTKSTKNDVKSPVLPPVGIISYIVQEYLVLSNSSVKPTCKHVPFPT